MFGASGGGFGGGSQFGAAPQPSSTGGLFGGGGGGGGSAFGGGFGGAGSTGAGSSLFGGQPATGTGGSLFGGQPSTGMGGGGSILGGGSSGFGGSNQNRFGTGLGGGLGSQSTGGTSLFGNPSGGGGGAFGQQPSAFGQPTSTGFGAFGTNSGTQSGGLFSSGGGTMTSAFGQPQGTSTFGGGLALSPATTFNRGTSSSMFSPGGLQFQTLNTLTPPPNVIPTYRFIGFDTAIPIVTHQHTTFANVDASDLQFIQSKSESASAAQQPQNTAEKEKEYIDYVKNRRIPLPFQDQLVEQAIEIGRYDSELEKLSKAQNTEEQITRITSRTKEMEQMVRLLSQHLERQAEAVIALKKDLESVTREAEKGAREVDRLKLEKSSGGQQSGRMNMYEKQLPGPFFQRLVEQMKEKITDFDGRTEELKRVLKSKGGYEDRRRDFQNRLSYEQILDVIQQQFRAFRVLEEHASKLHAEADALRNEYRKRFGHDPNYALPSVGVEDNYDRDMRRRHEKKVNEKLRTMASQQPQQQQQPSQQQQQQPLALTSGSSQPLALTSGSSQPLALTSGSSLTTGGTSMVPFGSTTPAQQQPGATGGLFGTSTLTTNTGSGLFGSNPATSTTTVAPPSFGGGAGGGLFSPAPSGGSSSTFGASTPLFGGGGGGGGGIFGGDSAFHTPSASGKKRVQKT